MLYKGYAPGQSVVIIDVLTDNKNRAISELRTFFNKQEGTLAESGSVAWMFDKLGVIRVPTAGLTEDELLEKLLEHDVKDIYAADNFFVIHYDIGSTEEIKQALTALTIPIDSAAIEFVPKNTIP